MLSSLNNTKNEPVPDYMHPDPLIKTSASQFRSLHEDGLTENLTNKWRWKREQNDAMRSKARSMAKRTIMECQVIRESLVAEQEKIAFNPDQAEVRLYLIDKVLPTLIMGVEKLLIEADKRKLIDTTLPNNNFNPINFIAQYLMRNNPKYSNFMEASPYVRSLREVEEQLREDLLNFTDDRLGLMKREARLRREEREREAELVALEKTRRHNALHCQFDEWEGGRKVELILVQNALRTFADVVQTYKYKDREEAKFSRELDATDDTGRSIHQFDYVEYVSTLLEPMTAEKFDAFIAHASYCAQIHQNWLLVRKAKKALKLFFISCDFTGVGLLNRYRILQLLEQFYEQCEPEVQETMNNPKQWPVVEVSEVDEFENAATPRLQDIIAGDNRKAVVKAANIKKLYRSRHDVPPEQIMTMDAGISVVKYPVCITQQTQKDMAKAFQERSILASMPHHGVESKEILMSLFRKDLFNVTQFAQLVEVFLDKNFLTPFLGKLISFLKENYSETEDEKETKLAAAHKVAKNVEIKEKLGRLFEIWDNEGRGCLEVEEVEYLLNDYNPVRIDDLVPKAKAQLLKEGTEITGDRMSKTEFCKLVNKVMEILPRTMESASSEKLVEHLTESLARSYGDQLRSELRKKWLHEIVAAAETSGAQMEPVYQMIFETISRDADIHSDDKVLSATIALLENNTDTKHHGNYMLRYTAATPDIALYCVSNVLYQETAGISFKCIETGKPVHIPSVLKHGGVHLWGPAKKPELRDGAMIAIPLSDYQRRVFGVMCIDTLNDPPGYEKGGEINNSNLPVFTLHDVSFYQGLAKAFSIAYHYVNMRQLALIASRRSCEWILPLCPHIANLSIFMVERADVHHDFTLRKMIYTTFKMRMEDWITYEATDERIIQVDKEPARLERKDNLFKIYLFVCCDTGQLVMEDIFEETHLAIPFRAVSGYADGVFDFVLHSALEEWERRQIMRMMKILSIAALEIRVEFFSGMRTILLAGDKAVDQKRRLILFDRLMLSELRDNIAKLEDGSIERIASYEDDPCIQNILQAFNLLTDPFHGKPQPMDKHNLPCKNEFLNPRAIVQFDPTTDENAKAPLVPIKARLAEIRIAVIYEHESLAAQHLFDWVGTCVSLIERLQM